MPKKTTIKRIVNKDTGEVLDTAVVYRTVKNAPRIRFPDGFLIISKTMDKYCKGMAASDYRLLFYLLKKVENLNIIHGNMTEWGVELGMAQPQVSRCMKTLVGNGIVTKKNSYSWELNPKCAWRGSASQHEAALTAIEQNK